jgi:DNA-binding GntR family transcriptional regulator
LWELCPYESANFKGEPQPMRKDIFSLIRNDIVHLKIKAGEPLNEIRLAKEFQVSRTPIREALLRLASEGLVTTTPNLGARVSEINLRDFRELIEFRIILERGAGHLIAINSTADDLRAMRQLYDKIQSENTEDLDRLTDLDSEFHFIIRRAAHNPLLEKQMEVIQIKFTWLMRSYHYTPTFVFIKIPDIIEAMDQRNSKALERMLVQHVEYFVDRLREETMKKF